MLDGYTLSGTVIKLFIHSIAVLKYYFLISYFLISKIVTILVL